ncbi:hypothetical protein [Paraburkholderia unamae]|uniref:Uncharacterized protein n=1 Tax=Paraburkholderia unamae TaxID=219649 RepID=A0ABX5KTJ5_9BURK|nr:hypothetical protein [Paraburkholderia unamae]PVX86440.1 hypothetical protein C7402_102276 [Paraburkholderia unamae]
MTTEATLTLSADQQAVARKKITDLHHAVGTIYSIVKEGRPLDAGLATNCVKVAEFNLSDLCKTLGVETFSSKEREQRYADLRAANMKVHELEAQLGGTVTPEATQHTLKNMADHLNRWWDIEGFGHISEISFGQYVCKVDFSCSLFGDFRILDSETPVSDKGRKVDWHDSLRDRGFALANEDRDWSLVDNDANRQVLIDLFGARLPSSKVHKFENYSRRKSQDFSLRSVEVYIYKIAEILALPVPSKAEA